MAKSKVMHKKRKPNPAKEQMLAARAIKAGLRDHQRDRSRMIWFMVLALADNDKIDIDVDTLLEVIDSIKENIDDYDRIGKEDGFDIADEKLNMRVNKILGRDEFADTPEKLYNPAGGAEE